MIIIFRKAKIWLPFLCFIILILSPKPAISGSLTGIELCLKTIIPTMLPFIILIQFLINNGIILPPLIAGFLCGFPTGAITSHELYKNNRISKSNYQTLAAISNNASLGFILFAVGFAIYRSIKIGWFLLIIQIVTSLLMWLIFCRKRNKNDLPKQIHNRYSLFTIHYSLNKSNPFKQSALIMSTICTTIIFFSSLISMLQSWHLPPPLTSLIEITNGISAVPPLPFTSFLLGSSGLCVAFQTFSVCPQINKQKYFLLKLTQGLLAAILTSFIFLF